MDQHNASNLNGFYGRTFPSDEMQGYTDIHSGGGMMGVMSLDGMDSSSLMGGQTLDEIINENSELQRRRSYHPSQSSHSYGSNRSGVSVDPRRSSMLEFGNGTNGGLDGFQFDPPSPHNDAPLVGAGSAIAQRRMHSQGQKQRHPVEGLHLNTQFQNMGQPFHGVPQSSNYHQPLNQAEALNLGVAGPSYLPQSLPMNIDFPATGLDGSMGGDTTPINLFAHGNYHQDITPQSAHHNMTNFLPHTTQDPGGGPSSELNEQDLMEKMPNMQMSDQIRSQSTDQSQPLVPMASATASSQPEVLADLALAPESEQKANDTALGLQNHSSFSTGDPIPGIIRKANVPEYRNAYSSTGFDMLGVLMRVATRPKPQISIGAVDMSCAFAVCDVTQHDIPIVYCSDIFERLTGYTKHEILGRNCRFLQAPDGKVTPGVKRKYVDDQAVLHLKNMISQRMEAQISIINYRKGGQPFMNLLTMIPICWDDDVIKYYVGFQVDLVEQPTSITNKNPDGSYAINYQRGMLPRYVFQAPDHQNQSNPEMGQTIGRDEVSTVLSTIGTGESELSKRIWDKVLLENTDDVVHVLSLKGLFLYLSPSSRKVLEYEPGELVGTALSSVCHPSDIVPVTRELKDTSSGTAVNVVYRIRRKHSGYTWFESFGALHTEQGKGRKCIIMVGRERPVYVLARTDIISTGGIGESELWTKMSTSGMFLYVSSNVRSLLDRQPEDLIATSAQALMRADSKLEFGRILEIARTGVRCTFKHDILNKRGQTLQAQTTIYPGDACEGQKPTFLVAQTRLLKLSRSLATMNRQNSNGSNRTDQASAGSATPATNASASTQRSRQEDSPHSSNSNPNAYADEATTSAGCAGLAIGNQHEALASEENVFDELKTTRSTSWQFELRQMEKRNRLLAEELQSLLSSKKKRKRRKGAGQLQKDCANCHTRVTPEWRRGPSGNRDLCNSCGLRWAKQNGRVSPHAASQSSDKNSGASQGNSSPVHTSPLMTSMSSFEAQQQWRGETKSPQTINADSHHAKTGRMEAVASQGYGGGIPAKIEEADEPMESIR